MHTQGLHECQLRSRPLAPGHRDDPAEFVDISYRVSERKYLAWPEAIRRGFQGARVVRTAAPSFTLNAPEGSA